MAKLLNRRTRLELKSKTIKAVRWNFVSTAFGVLVALLQLWIFARILPSHEYGVVSLALILIQFMNIFLDFGISNSIVRRSVITELELSSLYVVNLVLGVLTFVAAFLSAELLASYFKSPELVLQIRLLAFGFLLAPFAQQQRAIMVREMQFDFIAMVAVSTMLINFVVGVGLAWMYHQAWAASVAFLVSTASSSAIFFHRGLRARKFSMVFHWPSARPHLRYAIELVGDSLINVVSVNTYPALMARLVDLTAIGGYNIAYGVSINLVDRLKPVLMQALFPAFAKIQDDDSKLARNFIMVVSYAALINFPLLSGLYCASTPLVRTFFQPQWYFIDELIRILCLIGLFRSVDVPVISLLLVKAKMYLNVRMGIAKLIVGIALAYYLGRRFGITGIAYSFLIVQVANTVLGYFFLVKPCLPSLGGAYLRAIVVPVVQIVPLVLMAVGLSILTSDLPAVARLCIIVVGGVVGYALGLWFSPFVVVRDFLALATKSVGPRLERVLQKRKAK